MIMPPGFHHNVVTRLLILKTLHLMLKQIFIPLAALAITATTASAFVGGDMLDKLNISLTDTEQSALEQAHEIRENARTEAKQVLEDAGITDERMEEIHDAMREARQAEHQAVKAAIEANDYAAFKTAVADSPMGTEIDTEAEFKKLVEAHTLREAGDMEAARAIMEELGLKGPGMGGKGMGGGRGGDRPTEDN
jgi:cell division septum initiation protein DivIVA